MLPDEHPRTPDFTELFPAKPESVVESKAQKLVCPEPVTRSNERTVLLTAMFFTALKVPVGSAIGTEKSLPTRAE